jgi:hypothetical protein
VNKKDARLIAVDVIISLINYEHQKTEEKARKASMHGFDNASEEDLKKITEAMDDIRKMLSDKKYNWLYQERRAHEKRQAKKANKVSEK